MKNYKEKFKGKKITIMGLGLLGRGLGYTKFLAECGADLIVTDLKTKEQLANSLKQLKKYNEPAKGRASIKYTLGEHKLEDFQNRDIVMKMAGVPKDSIYIEEAKKTGAEIEMDVSLLVKTIPEVVVVGITGTRGKSMTTTLIYEILKDNEKFLKRKVYLGGNIRGVATLPLLKKIEKGDILVCELDSWQLQGFGDSKISPHISVFTSFMPDHMNYYKGSMEDYFNDKALIYKNQKKGDILITNREVKKLIKDSVGKIIIANKKDVYDWKFIVPGDHQRQNLAYAVSVVKQFGIPETKIKNSVKKFKGVEGRLQFLGIYKGIKVYNDNNATTPEATIVGIKAVMGKIPNPRGLASQTPGVWKNIILICGGSDKKVDLTNFVKIINKNCKFISFIPGTGTDFLLNNFKIKVSYEIGKDLKDVVNKAFAQAKKGDIILFSPAFASFGMFINEYDRNDQFIKLVKKFK